MILDLLAAYMRDLLVFPAENIIIGRENFRPENSATDYIVVDDLVSAPVGKSSKYDENLEQYIYTSVMKTDVTINFYGDNSVANGTRFINLQLSQLSYELQRDSGFVVYHVNTVTDLKKLEGAQYKNRYELSATIHHNESETVGTLRIDSVEPQIIVSN